MYGGSLKRITVILVDLKLNLVINLFVKGSNSSSPLFFPVLSHLSLFTHALTTMRSPIWYAQNYPTLDIFYKNRQECAMFKIKVFSESITIVCTIPTHAHERARVQIGSRYMMWKTHGINTFSTSYFLTLSYSC